MPEIHPTTMEVARMLVRDILESNWEQLENQGRNYLNLRNDEKIFTFVYILIYFNDQYLAESKVDVKYKQDQTFRTKHSTHVKVLHVVVFEGIKMIQLFYKFEGKMDNDAKCKVLK